MILTEINFSFDEMSSISASLKIMNEMKTFDQLFSADWNNN